MMRDMTKYTCHQSESESERTSIYSSLRFLVGYENLSSESDAIRKEKPEADGEVVEEGGGGGAPLPSPPLPHPSSDSKVKPPNN